jgi:hypothetical protein
MLDVQGHDLRRLRACALIFSATLMLSCAEVDLSGADRCESHADCRPGRACLSSRCIPIGELPIGRSDGAVDAGNRSHAGTGGAPGTAGNPAGAGGRMPLAGGMDGGATITSGSAGTSASMDAGGGQLRDADSMSGAGDAQPGPETGPVLDHDAGSDEDGGNPDPIPPPPRPREPCEDESFLFDGVALWLDAAYGVTANDQGEVQRWLDRSPNQHEAEAPGEALDWPLLVDAAHGGPAIRFGSVAGRSAVRRFSIPDHASLRFGTEPFAIIAVLQHHTPTVAADPELTHGAIYMKLCECQGYIGPRLYANDIWPWHLRGDPPIAGFGFGIAGPSDYSTRTFIGGYNDNSVHVVLASRIGDELSVYVDGELHAGILSTTTLDVSNPGVDITIGSHFSNPIQALEGDLFELIAITGDAARRARERSQCLMKKYGLH